MSPHYWPSDRKGPPCEVLQGGTHVPSRGSDCKYQCRACSKQEQVHQSSSIIHSPDQDVKAFIHRSLKTPPSAGLQKSLGSWKAIWRGWAHHLALENKQGNERREVVFVFLMVKNRGAVNIPDNMVSHLGAPIAINKNQGLRRSTVEGGFPPQNRYLLSSQKLHTQFQLNDHNLHHPWFTKVYSCH